MGHDGAEAHEVASRRADLIAKFETGFLSVHFHFRQWIRTWSQAFTAVR